MPKQRRQLAIGLVILASCLLIMSLVYLVVVLNDSFWQKPHPDKTRQHQLQPLYTRPKLTFGDRIVLPDFRLVAIYGTPLYESLGVLGAQDLTKSIQRAKDLAKEYQPFSTEPVIPAFEIIATVASAFPTEDGDYSQEIDMSLLEQWVDAAQKAGLYVILDLQPGRTSFLDQAKSYEPLLLKPNVGLALDPEWRIGPSQVHLVQIGTVAIEEVNAVVNWLADLVKTNDLPQKVLLLHQFMLSMIQNREQLATSRTELGYLIQMDGQGPQGAKLETWNAITTNPPANTHFGWKNFYQKDSEVRQPADVMSLSPKPYYVSFQ